MSILIWCLVGKICIICSPGYNGLYGIYPLTYVQGTDDATKLENLKKAFDAVNGSTPNPNAGNPDPNIGNPNPNTVTPENSSSESVPDIG